MKRILTIAIAVIGTFAVLAQLYLILANRVTGTGETILRFFSFFTILTNSLVAVYFSWLAYRLTVKVGGIIEKPAALTALTVYIFVVGLVYQVALRFVWKPVGIQRLVDELLHSVIPVLVLLYWAGLVRRIRVEWTALPAFLIYPTVYLILVLALGEFTGFYPYYFIDPAEVGWSGVIRNASMLVITFVGISALFISITRIARSK